MDVGPNEGAITKSEITMADSFTISKVTVTLNVQHEMVEQLKIKLIAPDSSVITLIANDYNAYDENFVDTVLDQVYNM